jgi:hypothetical protein
MYFPLPTIRSRSPKIANNQRNHCLEMIGNISSVLHGFPLSSGSGLCLEDPESSEKVEKPKNEPVIPKTSSEPGVTETFVIIDPSLLQVMSCRQSRRREFRHLVNDSDGRSRWLAYRRLSSPTKPADSIRDNPRNIEWKRPR